jgi:hypothetical protein
VHLDTDGNPLIDARNTWTTYKVNRSTRTIIWRLGGRDSSFTLKAAPGQALDSANELFAWQPDPEALGNDLYTFFDNESAGKPELPYSRAVSVKLDEQARVPYFSEFDAPVTSSSTPSFLPALTHTVPTGFRGSHPERVRAAPGRAACPGSLSGRPLRVPWG